MHASERTENNENKSNRIKVETPIFKKRESTERSDVHDDESNQDFQTRKYDE